MKLSLELFCIFEDVDIGNDIVSLCSGELLPFERVNAIFMHLSL